MKDETKLLAALASARAAGLTLTEIRIDVFGHHRTKDQLRTLLDGLVHSGKVESWKEPGNGKGGPHSQRFRVSMPVPAEAVTNNGNGYPEAQRSEAAMHDESEPAEEWTPPEGEGWVSWAAVVRIAEAGVGPGFALRQGKKFRRQQLKTKEQLAAIPDEQFAWYGARRISHRALMGAVYRGNIERRGEWCRLVRDPVTTQRMWMSAVYQVLGEAHPTLTGEFTPKPPKTLASVMQEYLGRELLREEFVRRRPGRAGAWDPTDMKLHSSVLTPSDVEENEQRLAGYRIRVTEALTVQEQPRFRARLPHR